MVLSYFTVTKSFQPVKVLKLAKFNKIYEATRTYTMEILKIYYIDSYECK